MNTTIPCKRPKVVVVARHPGSDAHDAVCQVTRCGWTYPADTRFVAFKSDAQERATSHRAEHRRGVPVVEDVELDDRPATRCTACGWTTPAGFTTRTDRDRLIGNHLADHHGVVKA